RRAWVRRFLDSSSPSTHVHYALLPVTINHNYSARGPIVKVTKCSPHENKRKRKKYFSIQLKKRNSLIYKVRILVECEQESTIQYKPKSNQQLDVYMHENNSSFHPLFQNLLKGYSA